MEKFKIKFINDNILNISINEKFIVSEVELIALLEKKMVFGDG